MNESTERSASAYRRRQRGVAVAAAAFAALAAGAAARAGAAVFTVATAAEPASATSANCSVGNVCDTLRDAFNAAMASADATSVILFDPAVDGQTIELAWCSNAASGTEFGPSSFFVAGGKGISLDGVTGLTRGITIERGSLTATGCAEFRLFDVDGGAALSLTGLTLKNGIARGGSASFGGGALGAGGAIFSRGTVVIDRSTFLDNVAQGGDSGIGTAGIGGAGVGGNSPNGSNSGGPPNAGVFGVQFDGGFGGGGIAYDGGGNGGFGGGGGEGGTSGGNGGFGAGGGAYGSGSAGLGGFGGGSGGAYSIGNSGGAGAGMGGAIFNDAGTLTATNSTFAGNSAIGGSASGAGAGSGFGGAIFSYSGATTIQFATMAHNSVVAGAGNAGTADGSSLYHLDDGSCASGGNACANPNAMLTIDVSILYYDHGGTNDLVAGAINSGISSWSCNNGIVASQSGIDPTCVSPADPLLSPLGNHGGTSATMMPSEASPAIGTAYPYSDHDQRGAPRPSNVLSTVGAVVYDGDYLFANGYDN